MSQPFRPSWIVSTDASGNPIPYRPYALRALLLVNAALVALVGHAVASSPPGRTEDGITLGILWSLPYLVAAGMVVSPVFGQVGFGLAKGFAAGGLFLWGIAFLFFENFSNLAEGSNSSEAPYYFIAACFVASMSKVLGALRPHAAAGHQASRRGNRPPTPVGRHRCASTR